MAIELGVGSSRGRPVEWHDTIMKGGLRKGGIPKNCDIGLAHLNEHVYGDLITSDGDKFNEIFQPSVDKFNEGKIACRRMGPTSSKKERQKSYYEGIVDGTWCSGSGETKEKPVYEAVLQIGNREDNGTTDNDFDGNHWYSLKQEGDIEGATAYALEHLNPDREQHEKTKRILKCAVDRIVKMDPEHLIVLRADYHSDEPNGTPHIHIAFSFRGTEYKYGMKERCASVTALLQMGFKKTKTTEYGISQLHERFSDIIEEEMNADAEEYGYEPIKRKAPSGEHRKHSDVDTFREMAAQAEALREQQQVQTIQAQALLKQKQDQAQTELDQEEMQQQISEQREMNEAWEQSLRVQEDELKVKADAVERGKLENEKNAKDVSSKAAELQEREETINTREINAAAIEASNAAVKKNNELQSAQLTKREEGIEDTLRKAKKDADDRDTKQNARDIQQNKREAYLKQWHTQLQQDQRDFEKEQERDADEFQKREDALEARERANAEWEQNLQEREAIVDKEADSYYEGVQIITGFMKQINYFPPVNAINSFIEFSKQFKRTEPDMDEVDGKLVQKMDEDGNPITKEVSCYDQWFAAQKRKREFMQSGMAMLESEVEAGRLTKKDQKEI